MLHENILKGIKLVKHVMKSAALNSFTSAGSRSLLSSAEQEARYLQPLHQIYRPREASELLHSLKI